MVEQLCFENGVLVLAPMSTVIAMRYTQQGFVMGSDGLVSASDDRRPLETEAQKVFGFKVAPTIGFGLAGVSQFGDGFNVAGAVGKMLEIFQPSDSPTLAKYMERIFQPIIAELWKRNTAGAIHFDNNKEVPGCSGEYIIARIMVCGYFHGVAGGVDVILSHKEQTVYARTKDMILAENVLISYGSDEVSARFRHHPDFATYRTSGVQLHQNVALSNAANDVKGLIEAHGGPEGLAIDEPVCSTIGGRTQIATITSNEGFRWLQGFPRAMFYCPTVF